MAGALYEPAGTLFVNTSITSSLRLGIRYSPIPVSAALVEYGRSGNPPSSKTINKEIAVINP